MKKELKKVFNQETMEIEEMKIKQTYKYELDIPATYGFSYYQQLDHDLMEWFKDIERSDTPTNFQIVGDFKLLEEADVDDRIIFVNTVVNLFASNFVIKGTSNGRGRFASPRSIDDMELSMMLKRDLINREILFPIFAMEVVDKEGNLIFEVI